MSDAGPKKMSAAQVITQLATLQGWQLYGDGDTVAIEKTFAFKGYLRSMAFANAVAYLAQSHNHHPEMLIRFSHCSIRYNTTDVNGISQLDIKCARLVDALYAMSLGNT